LGQILFQNVSGKYFWCERKNSAKNRTVDSEGGAGYPWGHRSFYYCSCGHLSFIASLEKKINVPSEQLDVEDNFIAPLHPFLHDRTNMFWHELRYII
jgi:hypothetical protein